MNEETFEQLRRLLTADKDDITREDRCRFLAAWEADVTREGDP